MSQPSERLSPNEIVSKTFTVTRRGFKPEEVNRYLALIGSYISEQHRLYDLLAAKVRSQSTPPQQAEVTPIQRLDLASITSALGEEAAEILKSATAAGESIRAKANEYAKSVREATDSAIAEQEAAHRLAMAEELQEHRAEIDRITQEANTKITSEVQRAEELARTLVQDARNEADSIVRKAKDVRAEVYAEIDRRTIEAREILQLIESQKSQYTQELRAVQSALSDLLGEVDPDFVIEKNSLKDEETPQNEVLITDDQVVEVVESVEQGVGVGEIDTYETDATNEAEKEISLRPRSTARVLFFDDTDSDEFEGGSYIEPSQSDVSPQDGGLGRWPSIGQGFTQFTDDNSGEIEISREVITELPDSEELDSTEYVSEELESITIDRPEVAAYTKPNSEPNAFQLEKRHGDHQVVESIFSRLLDRPDEIKEIPSNSVEVELGWQEIAVDSESVFETAVKDDLAMNQVSEVEDGNLSETISSLYEEFFAPLRGQASRRIKRVVQDDQNSLLEGLRIGGVDEAKRIVSETESIARAYADVMGSFVQPVVEESSRYFQRIQILQGAAGGKWNVSVKPSVEMRAAVDELALELAEEVSTRVLGVITAGVGDELAALSTRLGATFRELKTEFVETLVSDMISILVSTWLITCTDIAKVTWVRGGPGGCADCEDNELEGIIDVGNNFPTGNPAPPAHIGCRCLLVPYFA